MGVLWFQRRFDRSLAHQRECVWKIYPQRAAADYHVGVMGPGEIGGYIASQLAGLGYRVSGWARSEKSLAGVRCYHGEAQASEFLGQLDALINVLPLTDQTRGILAHPLLQQLPDGASLINCGRGEHMVNQDVPRRWIAANCPARCWTSSLSSRYQRKTRYGNILRW
jgi:glyoxylate/hydroxypyruvate reductase A